MFVVTFIWGCQCSKGEVLRPNTGVLVDPMTMRKSTNFGELASMSMPAAQARPGRQGAMGSVDAVDQSGMVQVFELPMVPSDWWLRLAA